MDFKTLAETITNKLINRIESADLADSLGQLWTGGAFTHFAPTNATTGNYYNGFNILALYIAGTDNGHPTAEWATYRQWTQQQAQVRKGETGTHIVKWVPIKNKDADKPNSNGDDEQKTALVPKVYSVFNAAQVDGHDTPTDSQPFEPIEAADQFITNTEAIIKRGSHRAFYSLRNDTITLPNADQFINTEAHYAVALHELTHWTGAPHRLNRNLTNPKSSLEYAFEELVAELGAAMLCARLNITPEPRDDHATYLKSWLAALRNDPKHIVTAASKARAAIEHLEGLQTKQPEQRLVEAP